jgi:hypothetical protein
MLEKLKRKDKRPTKIPIQSARELENHFDGPMRGNYERSDIAEMQYSYILS